MLTDSQLLALDIQNDLSVTANAGAGKTRVLVERFVKILLETNLRVGEIVAITFTEKAASELRRKISQHLSLLLSEPDRNRKERVRLEEVRDQLASANIETIHAFCAQLLREYPIEAGVDAAFTLLEGADEQLLIAESLRETMDSISGGMTDRQEQDEYLGLVRMLGVRIVEKYLTIFLKRRDLVERLLAPAGALSPERSDDELLGRWNQYWEDELTSVLCRNDWLTAFQQIFPIADGKDARAAEALFRKMDAESSLTGKLQLYREFAPLVYTTDGKLRKSFTGRGDQLIARHPSVRIACSHRKAVSALCPDVDPGDAAGANSILFRSTRTLVKLYRKAADRYESKKLTQGQLDFEDLQIRARDLLEKSSVGPRIAGRYRYIMVDEFQDTNRLQYEIVSALVSTEVRGNLFIVGDPKQSIYGFRNAEVEVFEEAKLEISRRLGEKGNRSAIILGESFRPLSAIALFVNHIFRLTMRPGENPFEVPHQELIRGRSTEATGRVEFMLISQNQESDEEGKLTTKEAVETECTMIANKLLTLSRDGAEIVKGGSESRGAFAYRDAAILLRSRTHLKELERSLIAHHIPYVLSGGIGFYQKQEILDVLNYFKFLLNPADDVALAGVLRSPFFLLSDAELFEVSIQKDGVTFWEKLRKFSERHPTKGAIHVAVQALTHGRIVANRLPISSLVQKFFRQTGWWGKVSGLSSGNQHRANLDKLLRIARDFEGRGLVTLFDFVERLKALAAEEDHEGQASTPTDGNCVQVMTIHAAKGLEFPVVFLPFADKTFRTDTAPFLDPTMGIGFKIRADHDLNEDVEPTVHLLLQERNRRKMHAEEKRICYVACTRARDMLFISGRYNPDASAASYLGWMVEALGISGDEALHPELTIPSRLKVLNRSSGRGKIIDVPQPLRVYFSSVGDEREAPQTVSERRARAPLDQVHILPLSGQSQGEFYSATQIKTFIECPSKYYLKYVLGLPEQHSAAAQADVDDDPTDKLYGEVEGLLTHSVLQTVGSARPSDAEIAERVRTHAAASLSLSDGDREELLPAVIRNVCSFLDSPFGRGILSGRDARTEFALTVSFGQDYLSGIIDRLFRDENGLWNILDYKTDAISPSQIQARSDLYLPQLLFYGVLIRRLYKQEVVPCSILFTKNPDHPVRFRFSDPDLDKFEAKLELILQRIKRGDFSREIRQCEHCPFQFNGNCLSPMKFQRTG